MTHREQRRALIRQLRDVEGLTFAAIGQQLDMSREDVRQIYLRASRRKPRRKPTRYQVE
jgi:DNA-directed RNA polymerase sigma subunit (sigma70/sigma32)